MKNLICLIIVFILFLAKTTNAQSLIAVQNDSGSTFYSTLDSAITKAVSGDYIYIPGGVFTISVPINKQLQIVGVGHNPDSCAQTSISQVTGSFNIKSGSNHGLITGLKISGGITFTINPTDPIVDYYSIERCNIGGAIILATRSSNILVNECILRGNMIYGNNTQGFQLSRCIIEGNDLSLFDSNAYFTNNIFLAGSSSYFYFSYVRNCYFRNNVFIRLIYDSSSNDFNIFQNNIFNSGIPLSLTNISCRNNITGPVTTLFKNQSGTVFDYKQNYHILPSSPAHNAGTDGTDLGIYGTGSPWKEGSLPSNPHIQSSSISTVNGNLNVKIKVAAQEN